MDKNLGSIDIVMSLETDEFKKAVNEVSKESKELRKDFKLLDAEIKNVERTEEGMANASKRLSNVLNTQESYVKQLENAQHRLAQEGKQGTVAFQRLSDNLRNARLDVERTKSSIHRLNSEMGKIHDKKIDIKASGLNGIAGKLGELATFGAIAGGLTLVGSQAIDVAKDFNKAQVKMQNSLGLTKDEMKTYSKVMSQINQDGLTQSMEESADVVVALKQNLGELTDEDMVKFGEQTAGLSHILGGDFNETLRSSAQLTRIFGDDTEKTFDMIAGAVQDGLNKHQDLLDTINEYSTYFAQAGFSSEEFFGILEQGLKNGIQNTDKVADGVKEFQIALNDGRIKKGIGAWSQQTQDLFKQYEGGKATAKEVFDSMVSDINRVKTKEEKQQLVNATGISQWEDWGTAGFDNMAKVGKKADETTGKVKKIVDVEKQHKNGWLKLWNVANSTYLTPMFSWATNFAGSLADSYFELDKLQKKADSIKSAPLVSPAGYSNPTKNIYGTSKPSYQNKSVNITQNNNFSSSSSPKDINKANKKLEKTLGRGW